MDQLLPNSLRRSASSMHNSVDFMVDGSENEFYFVEKSLGVPFQWETEPGRTKSRSEMPPTIYPLKPPPRLKRPTLHGAERATITLGHRSVSSKLKRFLFRLLYGISYRSDETYRLLLEKSPQVDEMEEAIINGYETSSSSAEVSASSPLSQPFSHHSTPKRFSASEIPTIKAFLNDQSEMLMDPILSMQASYGEDPSALPWILDPRIKIADSLSASPLKHPKLLTSRELSVKQSTVLPKTTIKLKDILDISTISESLEPSTEKCLSDYHDLTGQMGESEFSYTKPNSAGTELNRGKEDGKERLDARPDLAIRHVNRHRMATSVSRRLKAFVRDGICGSRHRPTQR